MTTAQDEALTATRDDGEVQALVAELEDEWDWDWLCETDKAWDAMHRCLSDGTLLLGRPHPAPLELVVLGGAHHHEGEEYLVVRVDAADVARASEALDDVSEAWLRERYDAVDPDDYQGTLGAEDFEYTWQYLQDVRDFYKRAAAAGRSVIFTVDQ